MAPCTVVLGSTAGESCVPIELAARGPPIPTVVPGGTAGEGGAVFEPTTRGPPISTVVPGGTADKGGAAGKFVEGGCVFSCASCACH